MEAIEEDYWNHASPYDNHRVFGQILLSPDDSRRRSHSQVSDPNAYRRFLEAARSLSEKEGEWMGRIDIKDFYRQVKTKHVFELLGSKGLGLDWRTTERLSIWIEELRGLPQGIPTSHCVARLILTAFDREAADMGIPLIRQADDIWVFGESQEAVYAKMMLARSILFHCGFECNEAKWTIESPERIEWVRQGIFWDKVRIEDYGSPLHEIVIESVQQDPLDSSV